MSYKISHRGECRVGRVQVEDWTSVYPNIPKEYITVLFTTLLAIPRNSYLRDTEHWRIEFHYDTMDEAIAARDHLMNGGDPHDLTDAMYMSRRWTDWDIEHCLPH